MSELLTCKGKKMFSFTTYYLDDKLVRGRVLDVFMPEKVTQKTALFFVHGGGWTNGSRDRFHEIMQAFGERGFICASTDYRLLPMTPGKRTAADQLADVRESYDAFVSILKEKNIVPEIAAFGSSAGAHLASLLVCALPGECGDKPALKNDWIQPVCGMVQATPASFVPWPESYPAMWGMMERAAGGTYEEVPENYRRLSLENYIRKDNPPLFFMEAENEGLFPGHYNKVLLEKHLQWGLPSQMKVYQYAEHGFFYDLSRPIQLEAFEDIFNFVKKING